MTSKSVAFDDEERPLARPPSDDEQEDFYFDEEEEEEFHRMYLAEKEKEREHALLDLNAKKVYNRDKMLSFRQQTIFSIIQSPSGKHPFHFDTRKGKYDEDIVTVTFSPKVNTALDILGSLDFVTKEFTVARKNRTVTVTRRNRSENAWVPGALSKHVNTPEKVRSEMIDILNKMTPEKYDKLFLKFFKIEGLRELENIRVLVKCILDKVLLEKSFSDTYTKLCKDIGNYDKFEHRDFFKKCLLQETQIEFENGLNIDSKMVANKNDPEEYAEVEEKKSDAKRRLLGNMRFIAELFKVKLLHPSLIIQIFKDLFTESGTPDEGNVEAICELMTCLGALLPERLSNIVFRKLEELLNHKYKTRILFLIENVIDLRDNNWVPNIAEAKAEKINKKH